MVGCHVLNAVDKDVHVSNEPVRAYSNYVPFLLGVVKVRLEASDLCISHASLVDDGLNG